MFNSSLLRSASLIFGTAVGASTLILPFTGSVLGLPLLTLCLLFCSVLMFFSGIFLAEVNSCFPKNTSFISISSKVFGFSGQLIAYLGYFSLMFCLMVAYIHASSELIYGLIDDLFTHNSAFFVNTDFIKVVFMLLAVLLFISGRDFIVKLNELFVFFLLGSILILTFSLLYIRAESYLDYHFCFSRSALSSHLPMLMTAFGYQIIVPSLVSNLNRSPKVIMPAIVLGVTTALLFYIIWSYTIITSSDSAGLSQMAEMLNKGKSAEILPAWIAQKTGSKVLSFILTTSFFMAIFTSFLGVGLSFYDMVNDILNFYLKQSNKYISIAICLFLPLLGSLFWLKGFEKALGFGGYIVLLLNGLFPCFLLLKTRSNNELSSLATYQSPFSNITVLLVITVFLLILFI